MKSLVLCGLLSVSQVASAGIISFGEADNYNLFVNNIADLHIADSQGAVAAREVTLTSYDVGVNNDNTLGVTYSTSLNRDAETRIDGSISQVDESYFDQAFKELKGLSSTLKTYTPTHSTFEQFSALNLIAKSTDPVQTAIGFIDGDDFTRATGFKTGTDSAQGINDATALILNISGKSVELDALAPFALGLDFDLNNIVYNFYEATRLNIVTGNDMFGNILAPLAEVHHTGGLFTGRLIADSYFGNPEGGTQLNYLGQFGGITAPKMPEPPIKPPISVDEPHTAWLLILGLGLLGLTRRKQIAI